MPVNAVFLSAARKAAQCAFRADDAWAGSIELGNLVLHLGGYCRVADRGPTMQQRVAYLGQ